MNSIKIYLTTLMAGLTLCGAAVGDDDLFERQRKELLNRKREILWDDDGCDMSHYPYNRRELVGREVSVANFEKVFLNATKGTKTDVIGYSGTFGFGGFTALKAGYFFTNHVAGAGEPWRNAAVEFAKLGTDAHRMAVDFAHRNGKEAFLSLRFNDNHDALNAGNLSSPLLTPFKRENQECMVGYGGTVKCCGWTAMDFAQEKVRAFAKKYIRDFLENYDYDGVLYDFFRHPQLFRTVAKGGHATDGELVLMTAFMKELRKQADEIGRKRGRPFILSARVPDSLGYCRAIGIDLEAWLKEKTIDFLVVGGYFQLEPWAKSAAFAHRHGVKCYASIDESRIGRAAKKCFSQRNACQCLLARTSAAMAQGMDGVFYFNFEYDTFANQREVLNAGVHDLDGRDKWYFSVYNGGGGYLPRHFLADGMDYWKTGGINPMTPVKLAAGESFSFVLPVGDDLANWRRQQVEPKVAAKLLTDDADAKAVAAVSVNGKDCKAFPLPDGAYGVEIDPSVLVRGDNQIVIKASAPVSLCDFMLTITRKELRKTVAGDSVVSKGDTAIQALVAIRAAVDRTLSREAYQKVDLLPLSTNDAVVAARNAAVNYELGWYREWGHYRQAVDASACPRHNDLESTTHLWRTLQKDRKPWWLDRLAERQAQIAALPGGEVDVAMIGDSITHWWEYVDNAVYPDLKRTYSILNLGYGGDRSNQALWRVKNGELDGYRAKVVTVMIGTNDQRDEFDTSEKTAARIGEIVATIRAKQPQAKVLLMAIFPRCNPRQTKARARSARATELIRQYADGENVLFCDFRDAFLKDDDTGRFDLLYDGTHPGPNGLRAWRDRLLPYFEKYVGKKHVPNDPKSVPFVGRWIRYDADFNVAGTEGAALAFAAKAKKAGYTGICLDAFPKPWRRNAQAPLGRVVAGFKKAGLDFVPILRQMPDAAFERAVQTVEQAASPSRWFVSTNDAVTVERQPLKDAMIRQLALIEKNHLGAEKIVDGRLFSGFAAGFPLDTVFAMQYHTKYFVERKLRTMYLCEINEPAESLYFTAEGMVEYPVGAADTAIYWTDLADYRLLEDVLRLSLKRE